MITRSAALEFFFAASLLAQFARLPEAQSPEEFDAYLRVMRAPSPEAAIAKGEDFCRAWPRSEFLGHVHALQFEAWRKLGDSSHAIAAAEKSLEEIPGNLEVMADLAVILGNGALANGTLANRRNDAKRLARAQELARTVIETSKSFRIPRSITPEEWDRTFRRLNSQAHAALGLVANAHGDLTSAINEFESAVTLAPSPDATQYYRLGILHRTEGNIPEAIRYLRRAAELDEPAIRAMAQRQLEQIGNSGKGIR